MQHRVARIILFTFAILAVAFVLFLRKKHDRETALAEIEKINLVFNHYQEELHVQIKDPSIRDLSHLADLFARAERFRDGRPIEPQVIDLTGNAGIQSLAGAAKLTRLRSITAIDCPALATVSGVSGLPHLNELMLSHNATLADVSGIRQLPSLVTLDLSRAGPLQSLSLEALPALENLYLSNCRNLRSIEVSSLGKLQQLYLDNCVSLGEIRGLDQLTSLTDLDLSNCESLKELSAIKALTALEILDLRNKEFPDYSLISSLPRLQVLRLAGQSNIENLEPFSGLKSLSEIYVESCGSLTSLKGAPPGLSDYAAFIGCGQLKSLDGIEAAPHLKHLDVSNCKELSDIRAVIRLPELVHLSLINCARITDIQLIEQNRNIRFVRLGGTSVPTASVDALQGKLPETVFDFSVE